MRSFRLIGFAGALLAAVALAPRNARAQVAAKLAPDSISGVLNQRKVVALKADMQASSDSLGSYAVTITWDSTVARLDSVAKNAQFGDPTVRYVHAGEVVITQANPAGMRGVFTLALLYFHIATETLGSRTAIQTQFTEFNAAKSFANLLPQLSAPGGVARALAPKVVAGFTPDSTHQRVGFKPEIGVYLDLSSDPDVGYGSATADVSWDSNVMLLDSVRAGQIPLGLVNQLSPGSVRMASADAVGRTGVVTVARMFFSFIGSTYPAQTTLTTSVSELHAAGSFGDLLPGLTVKNGKAVIAGWLRGDIDVSDAVTALDAATILNGVVGLPMTLPAGLTGLPQGDADCDGALTAKDAQIVLNHVVGNVVPFCVGKIQ